MLTVERAPHSDVDEAIARGGSSSCSSSGSSSSVPWARVSSSAAPTWSAVAFLMLADRVRGGVRATDVGVYLVRLLHARRRLVDGPWWPFTKNMSSRESILYLADGLSINPLEMLLAVTASGWLLQRLGGPDWHFCAGALFWPLVVFTGFVVVGLLHGQASGGDRRVAIFEARPLLYMASCYVLVTNLFTNRLQYRLPPDGELRRHLDPEHLRALVLPRAARRGAGGAREARPSTRRRST